ncbi:SpaH/EbpB family LPXTG-anchored major pilin [Streptococcus anginosus]|uniref:SpaH/EbpB family LPXTG-anchored major pilin n=1 Tax=Streptococcus anginosus TaxID=1328 RepID=UPI00195E534C|nr:SpaH/EbpB family LPXTG-anchored major pilin [Streptococcus anginosus]VTY21856.1 Cna protein B-type domain protein [Streptococcus anginosus]
MKNVKRYFLSFLAALSIVLLAFGADKTFATTEETYDIVLTKIKMNDLTKWPKQTGEDGTKYTGQKLDNIQSYFGAGSETLPGVWFEVHKYDDSKSDKVGDLVAGQEGQTDATGQITFKNLPAGKYMIVENKEKSTLASKEQLAKSAAVPVEITLPVFKAEGGWYTTGTDAVHVYPKNTVDKPTIDKVVNDSDKHDTATIGEKKTFKVTSKMPEGIADYKVLTYTDTFSKGLSYAGNLKVQKNGVDIDPSSYTLTQPAVGDKGATIKVEFKADYIKTLTSSDTIKITYDATINEDAVMGAANKNDVKVTYGTNPSVTKEEKPSETPELHTGGAKFKKQSKEGNALAGAIFELQDKDGHQITWTADLIKANKAAIDAGKFSTSDTTATQTSATTQPTAGQPIYLLSANDGTFEIKGLAYGSANKAHDATDAETEYQIKETKAPEGYALLQQVIKFKVSHDSYSATNKVVTVVNNKVTIPQTGGIGSALVIAAGVLVVGLGFIAKRRSAK